MKKSKLISLMVSFLLLTILSVQAMASLEGGDGGPDKACILEEFTPEHARLYCYGEGSYCSGVGDCVWLIE